MSVAKKVLKGGRSDPAHSMSVCHSNGKGLTALSVDRSSFHWAGLAEKMESCGDAKVLKGGRSDPTCSSSMCHASNDKGLTALCLDRSSILLGFSPKTRWRNLQLIE